MSYIESALVNGEHVVYTGKVSPWSLAPQVVIGLVLLPFWGVGLLFLIAAAIRYLTTELVITNRRVFAKFGFISRHTIEISIPKIESMQVIQGVLGRIFNFGSLVISGAGNPQAPVPGISAPLEFRRAFMELQDAGSAAQ